MDQIYLGENLQADDEPTSKFTVFIHMSVCNSLGFFAGNKYLNCSTDTPWIC